MNEPDLSAKFSVVIPTFNRLELLRETIASVKTQSYRSFEVIVVDDGSTDGTLRWLADKEPQVRVVQQTHRGPGAARNAGAQHATGTYLAFLDSDDLWFSWTLQTYAQIVSQQKSPAFVAGRQHIFSGSDVGFGSPVTEKKTELLVFQDYLSSSDAWRWWGVSSFVIRRDVFQRIRGFGELNVYGEDADLALKLGVEAGFVQVLGPPTFAYRQHATNSMTNLARIVDGARLMIQSENESVYPGGRARSGERLQIITRHIRPTILACLNSGRWRVALDLYRATFWWNLRLFRIRYLFAFPLLMIFSLIWSKSSADVA